MDPTVLGALIGVIGIGLGLGVGQLQRRGDRVRERQVRAEDRVERRALHWLDKKHESYADFLNRMRAMEKAIQDRWSPAYMQSYVEDGETKWIAGPYPVEELSEAQRSFFELTLISDPAVAKAAFDYLVHVTHWLNFKHEYLNAAVNRQSPLQPLGEEAQATLDRLTRDAHQAQEETPRRYERLRAAMRDDLGVGPDLDLIAQLGPYQETPED